MLLFVRSVKHNLAPAPSAVLCVASRAISITTTGLPRYLNPDYPSFRFHVEQCFAHRASSVEVKLVSSRGVVEYNIGRSTQRVKNALGYQYVQLDNQQDRRPTQLRVSRLGYISNFLLSD